MVNLLYANPLEYLFTLILDIFVVLGQSIVYLLETIYLTILPNKFRKLKNVSGQVVLITGGGGGVGRHLALKFAKLNAKVVIWDVNKDAINATVDHLTDHGYSSKGYMVDVSDREHVFTVAKKVIADVGNVDILINNAAIVCCKTFWDLPEKVIEKTYGVNILSHYWTAKAFLPNMMETNSGHIVTVASITGLMGTYACTDYSATKFACVGYHESLFSELKTHGYNNVNMTLVCPYYINTHLFRGVKPRLFPALEPEYVADRIVGAVQKNEVLCVLPDRMRWIMPFKFIMPAKTCWVMMSRIMRVPQSMMSYKRSDTVAAG